jgi:hypothetical protein
MAARDFMGFHLYEFIFSYRSLVTVSSQVQCCNIGQDGEQDMTTTRADREALDGLEFLAKKAVT